LINHEAQRIIGLVEGQAIGRSTDLLPKSISKILDKTLDQKTGQRDIDAVLFTQEEKGTPIRMGSAYLLGHDGKPMGALLVFTDMTELKTLEEQVRRADQLSSVGTLAAGMAHEIKNPLVTIKTFSQLLPVRYADEDFRNDFSSLVAHEVERIDGIVNQLLSFSKPAQPHLEVMNLHSTIEQTLKLIHEQLIQKNISLKNNCTASKDLISGDADLLTQALVNLNLNALDAIESDGTITVSTKNCTYSFVNPNDTKRIKATPCIRIQISDTGVGIEQTKLHKIFDPFFTSKSEGTGMGLSVAHGIIQEHHGAIEVESQPGVGTTFYIYLPLLKEDVVA
jgi:signal transduction histidine kinase